MASSFMAAALALAANQAAGGVSGDETPAMTSARCLDAMANVALADAKYELYTHASGGPGVRHLGFTESDETAETSYALLVHPSQPWRVSISRTIVGGDDPRAEIYLVDRAGQLLSASVQTAAMSGLERRDMYSFEVSVDLHEMLERFSTFGRAEGICT